MIHKIKWEPLASVIKRFENVPKDSLAAQFFKFCLLASALGIVIALSSLLIGCVPHDPSEATEPSVSCSDAWIEELPTGQQGSNC